MSWIRPIVKALAWTTVPVKIIDKGLVYAKSEMREEINSYGNRLKLISLIGAILLLFVLFGSMAAALLISTWLGANYLAGFSIVAGIYLVVLVILILVYKKKLLNPE